MKKFLLGFGLGIFSFLLVGDAVTITNDNYVHKYKTLYKLERWYFFPGLGLKDPLTGRCTKEIRQAPGGPKIIMRDYFECNKFQNKLSDLIYKR